MSSLLSPPRSGRFFVWLFPLLILVPLFYYPIATVTARAFAQPGGGISAARPWALIRDPYIQRVVGFTLFQAAASTLFSLLLGLPGAYFLARYRFPGKRFLRSATILPFVLPSILVVLGFVQFFGRAGVLNRITMQVLNLEEPPFKVLYSVRAILLAHAFYNFPICVRVVSSLWSRINPHLEEAARTLGGRGVRLFCRVIFPQILPAVLSAASLIFLFCFLSFAVVLVLGGGPRVTTVEVEVYRMARLELDLAGASALALIGLGLALTFLFLYIRFQRRSSFAQRLGSLDQSLPRPEPLVRWLGLIYGVAIGILVLGPVVTVVIRSVVQQIGWTGGRGFTLRWYSQILLGTATRFGSTYRSAVFNSVRIAAGASALAIVLGTPIAWLVSREPSQRGGLLEVLLMLPMAVSSVMLGLSYLTGFQGAGTSGRLAVVLAHAVITYPFVVRALTGVLAKIPLSLSGAASVLGAGPLQVFWHIELPLIRSGLLTGAAFAFALSMGEINAALLLSTAEMVTIPIAIYRLIGSYNYNAACAMGTVLLAVTLLAILVIDAPERVR